MKKMYVRYVLREDKRTEFSSLLLLCVHITLINPVQVVAGEWKPHLEDVGEQIREVRQEGRYIDGQKAKSSEIDTDR